MSDHYTFITEIIWHKPEKAAEIEAKLSANGNEIYFTKIPTPNNNGFYFAGYFKNLGGGPWPEVFDLEDTGLEVVIFNEDGTVFKGREALKEMKDA